jgi:hypothetical protein
MNHLLITVLSLISFSLVFANEHPVTNLPIQKNDGHNKYYCLYKSEKFSVGSILKQEKDMKICSYEQIRIDGVLEKGASIAQWQ